jgi:RNA polymerase sigma-70 factor (ECF subfamily)
VQGLVQDDTDIERLVAAWKAGERTAFDDLILRLHARLRLHVAAFCDSRELVDEVLQQTFVTAFHRIASFDGRGTFVAWLKTIARNHLIDHWRERRRHAALSEDLPEQVVADTGLADLDAEDAAAERARRLAACLEKLPARSRRLIERRHLDQRPLNEMARQFQQSMASLSVALHRIREALRRCIESRA